MEASDHGTAEKVEFRFKRSLDDPTLDFRVWRDDRYVPFEIPPIGSRARIDSAIDRSFFYGQNSGLSCVIGRLAAMIDRK